MPKYESLWVKGLNADIHLATKGSRDGLPVIFLPGITSYSMSFSGLLDRMPDSYYCLAMDIRGRGESSRPKYGHALSDYVEDLLNVLNALADNPQSPVLVGHSMGARLAAAFAASHSGLISGMVLIDPPVNGPGQRQVYPNPLAMFIRQKTAVDEGRMDDFRSDFPGFSAAQLEERAREYRNVSLDAIVESYESLLKEPFQIFVKAARCPTLLLAAEKGDTIRAAELQTLKNLNKRLEALVVPNVAHMIYKEAPEETAEHIVSFIERRACEQ